LSAWGLLLNIYAKIIVFNKIIITSYDCVDLHCQNRSNFTDGTNLPIQLLISFLLSFIMNSYHSEPNRFSKKLGRSDIPKSTVTKAAFAKARKTHRHRALLELNHKRRQSLKIVSTLNLWCGFRTLAPDVSIISSAMMS